MAGGIGADVDSQRPGSPGRSTVLVVRAVGSLVATRGARPFLAANSRRSIHSGSVGSGRPQARGGGRPAHADPPRHVRPDRPAPSPAEVEAFVADRSPDAFSKVVDRLLASPSTASGGAGTGSTSCVTPTRPARRPTIRCREAYRYRNYVIASFNADKPYDQFLREQIAGDLYAKDAPRSVRRARDGNGLHRDFATIRLRPRELPAPDDSGHDRYSGPGCAGTVVGLRRCHNHKFDPVTTARLLRTVRHLRQHALRVSRFRGEEASARFRSSRATVSRPTPSGRSSRRLAALSAQLEAAGRQPGAARKPSAS